MLSHWALEVGRGLQTWLGLQPDPTQSLPLLCLIRGQTIGDTYSPLEPFFQAWTLCETQPLGSWEQG